MFLGILGWAVLGLLVGFIASKLANLRGDDPQIGIGLALVAGIVGGVIYSVVSGSAVTGFNVLAMLFALVAAVAGVIVWHVVRRRIGPRAQRPW